LYRCLLFVLVLAFPRPGQAQSEPPTGVSLGTTSGGGVGLGLVRLGTTEVAYVLPRLTLPGLTVRVHHANNYVFDVDIQIADYVLTSVLGSPSFVVPMRHHWELHAGDRGRAFLGLGHTFGVSVFASNIGPLITSVNRFGPSISIEGVVDPKSGTQLGVLLQPDFAAEFAFGTGYLAVGFRLVAAFRVSSRVGGAPPATVPLVESGEGWSNRPPLDEPDRHSRAEVERAYQVTERLMNNAEAADLREGDLVAIRHSWGFESRRSAGEFTDWLTEEGYEVSILRGSSHEAAWVVLARHREELDLHILACLRLFLSRVARDFDGRYEGWQVTAR
jgi:hypothetical protein